MSAKESAKPLSVNFHLWQPCNYHCGFCFAGFEDVKQTMLPAGHLSFEQAESIIQQLGDYGFTKITFAGGEPTLCPWLNNLFSAAKNAGMVTMLVTNGSRLDKKTLKKYRPYLDWVVLSIDSISEETNLKGGRFHNRRHLPDIHYYRNLIDNIHDFQFKFKVNTVVHRYNKDEIMSDFIEAMLPLRWKLFKVLHIGNQNQESYRNFEISDSEFSSYVINNTSLLTGKIIVVENNDAMLESYLMIDPAGRFFDNSTGNYAYGDPICKVGIEKALQKINFNYDKYAFRGAVYEW